MSLTWVHLYTVNASFIPVLRCPRSLVSLERMPKEGTSDNYMRSSQPTYSCLFFAYVSRDLAVLNTFSQNKATSYLYATHYPLQISTAVLILDICPNVTLERLIKEKPNIIL